jgi:uncharacterized FlaG/YvyC family protein
MTNSKSIFQAQADTILIGQRVHSILYGGKDGTVVEIRGKQSPGSVRSFGGGAGVMGGSSDMDIIWDNGSQSRGIPESLARGSVQWRIYPDVATAEDIALAWANAAIFNANAQAKADEVKAAYQRSFEQSIKDYPNLTRVGDGEHGAGQFAAKNIRKELKAAWPKVKFSVKSDYDSVGVTWTDGPTKHQVEQIVSKYRNGGFDSMQDMATYDPTAFTNLFGGARYLSYYREFSESLLVKALDALYVRLPGNLANVPRPTVQDINNGRSASIPSHERTSIGSAVKAIAAAWDDAEKSYVEQSRSYELGWIVSNYNATSVCQPLL